MNGPGDVWTGTEQPPFWTKIRHAHSKSLERSNAQAVRRLIAPGLFLPVDNLREVVPVFTIPESGGKSLCFAKTSNTDCGEDETDIR